MIRLQETYASSVVTRSKLSWRGSHVFGHRNLSLKMPSPSIFKQHQGEYCIEPEPLIQPEHKPKATLNGIKLTVYHMYKRELAREANGNFQKSKAEELWTFLLVLTFAVLVGSVVYNADSLKYFLDQWKELGLITFAFPIAIFIILKLSLVLRWVLYWLVVATCVLFILNSFGSNREVAFWVFIGFVVIEIVTIVVYMISRLVYPRFMAYLAKKDPVQFWGIKPIPNREGYFTRKGFLREKRFSYVGEVNALNQPHGYGNWTSEWVMGEILSGFWKNGIPVGPFKAQEYRTGYSFSNLRIGVAATDFGGFKNSTFKRTDRVLYGVTSVECSTSGKFFNDLPRAILIADPFTTMNVMKVPTMLESLLHIDDHESVENPKSKRIVMTFDPIKGISIDGFIPKTRNSKFGFTVQCVGDCSNQETMKLKTLDIDGWQKSVEKEVLLYVPGFNCTLEDACETLGQSKKN